MNNLILICVFPEYAKQQYKRRHYQNSQVVGTQTMWGTPSKRTNFGKDMPFNVKMFHRIHTMADHGALAGNTASWRRAAFRLRKKAVMFPGIQKEWY